MPRPAWMLFPVLAVLALCLAQQINTAEFRAYHTSSLVPTGSNIRPDPRYCCLTDIATKAQTLDLRVVHRVWTFTTPPSHPVPLVAGSGTAGPCPHGPPSI